MRFTASYDTVTKVLSGAVCIFLLFVAFPLHNLVWAIIPLLVGLLGYAYSPRGYTIDGKSIVVHRLIGDVRIPIENARELRRVTPDDLRGCMRLWGSGGFFGYYGLFRTSKLGKCTWYATDRKKLIVLIGASKTTICSPDDADGFMAPIPLQAAILIRAGHEFESSLAVGRRSIFSRVVIGIAIAVAVAGALAAVFATRLSPGVPRYTLSRDELAIHDHFYPVTLKASAVDIDGIRVIDLDTDPDWMPTGRTNGFSNTHYHSGWYRLRNGLKVRLYRADGDRLVYLPSSNGDAPVLLEAADPDRLASDIEAEWQRRK